MTIFITGATGYIGIKLTLKLAEEGNIVHALYRSENKTKAIEHQNVKLFKGDITDPVSIAKAIKGCEEVYHAAAYAKVWAKDPDIFHKINVQGTINVLNAAKKEQVKKIVVTSTAGVFGPSFNSITDENAVRKIDYFSEYERTKAEAEKIIIEYAKNGLNVVMINPPRVYGPGLLSDSNGMTKMIKLYVEGKFRFIPGNGKSVGNYVFVDDVVEGHILAMKKGRAGERYLIGGENASYNVFFKKLAKVSGKKYFMFKLPLSGLLFIAYIMILFSKLFNKQPLIAPNWVRKYLYNWEITCEKAIKELGYQFTSLEEGFKKTIDWLEKNN